MFFLRIQIYHDEIRTKDQYLFADVLVLDGALLLVDLLLLCDLDLLAFLLNHRAAFLLGGLLASLKRFALLENKMKNMIDEFNNLKKPCRQIGH